MNSIRQTRRRLGLSQVELAEAAGVSPATVVEIERGRRQPQGRTLRKLSAALGVEVADLVEEEVDASPKTKAPLPLEPEVAGPPDEWEKAYARLGDRLVDTWFDELKEKARGLEAAQDHDEVFVRFRQWAESVRRYSKLYFMGLVEGYEQTSSSRLEAVIRMGAVEGNRVLELWKAIEEYVPLLSAQYQAEELQKLCEEAKADIPA